MKINCCKEDNSIYFYILLTFTLVAILFTNPFLRYPYDMIHHLIHIDRYSEITEIPSGRWIWHFFWAKFFIFFEIPNNEIFLRAKIIHILQTYIAFFSVYYFSKVVIRNIFIEIESNVLKYLSFWSVIVWFTIFATFSMYYQLTWNMWYSVNYQITLPLFWYITGLTLVLLLENLSWKIKLIFIVQILLISRFILQAHSMEYLYYLMYIFIFSIVYFDKVIYVIKKYYYIIIPVILSIVFFAKKYQPDNSEIMNYLSINKLPTLFSEISTHGKYVVDELNRATACINELMYIILIIGIIAMVIFIIKKQNYSTKFINLRVFIFVLLTSLFVLIPIYEYSAGLFALITRDNVVHRIYFSSSIFVLLPIFIYYILSIKGTKTTPLKINITILMVLLFVFLYSRYYTDTKVYYKNIISVKNSFIERNVGFNLSKEQIDTIEEQIRYYERNKKSDDELFFYARADISFVIKYIFGHNVYWEGRRSNPDFIDKYNNHLKNELQSDYEVILFKTPKGFPDYEPYK